MTALVCVCVLNSIDYFNSTKMKLNLIKSSICYSELITVACELVFVWAYPSLSLYWIDLS